MDCLILIPPLYRSRRKNGFVFPRESEHRLCGARLILNTLAHNTLTVSSAAKHQVGNCPFFAFFTKARASVAPISQQTRIFGRLTGEPAAAAPAADAYSAASCALGSCISAAMLRTGSSCWRVCGDSRPVSGCRRCAGQNTLHGRGWGWGGWGVSVSTQ